MIIKELEISGFKSFANKTRVHFDTSFTAVVGPNGCGKSNILDAVKWVLGEKSVKSIRGEKMEDVIFSGTETRKPANFAEVILTLDNETKIFRLDVPFVKIGRRLYRDGQSQYFINDKRVSRKEVEELLMDTGIGKSSYSFMEQGQMDMILSSKPEDRRYIFEEAAGISRYKSQRGEAEKNLENALLNITRLMDILGELEREHKLKTSQAEKTEKYRELIARQKEHDLKIRYVNLMEIDSRLQEYDEKLNRKRSEREKLQQKVLLMQEKLELQEKERREKTEELHTKGVTNQISRDRIIEWQNSIAIMSVKRKELDLQKLNIQQQMQKVEKRVKQLNEELAAQNQMTLQLDLHIEDARKALETVRIKLVERHEKEKKTLEAISSNGKSLSENRAYTNELREKMEVVIQDLLSSLKQETAQWEKFSVDRNKKIEALKNTIEKIFSDSNPSPNLSGIDKQTLLSQIDEVSSLPPGLYHILFEKGGVHSRKEELDERIIQAEQRARELEHEKIDLQENLEQLREEERSLIRHQETILGDIKSYNVQKDSFFEKEKNLHEHIAHERSSLQFIQNQFAKLDKDIINLDQEQKNREREITRLQQGIQKEIERIESLEKAVEKLEARKEEMLQAIHRENQKVTEIYDSMNELEVKLGTMIGTREAQIQDIYNDYNLTIDEIKEQIGTMKIQTGAEKAKLSEIQKAIEELGPINPLAIEELKTVQQLVDHNREQLEDLTRARNDILGVIKEIHQKSEELFSSTFRQVQENFAQIFNKLFHGGTVDLHLSEPEKPLESGIDIQVQPPGKRPRSLRLLSGGEKALTATALLFSLYMVKSSPFCILDEIDAPLDDQNVGRFLKMLEDFRGGTQFIIITHNKKTMHEADSIFGVTMEEAGVSKLMSVEINRKAVISSENA